MADDKGMRPRGPDDFADELKTKTPDEIREELDLPNIDQILKDLQGTHRVRIGFSPKMIARAEAIKEKGGEFIPKSACPSQDVCILCDHGDICATCDMMDWCVGSNDTHLVM
jgi:hypothetical protein